MLGRLQEIERQVRDYNRNNTALFSVLTDGREWRFYYSQTGGEFSQKCFESFNIESDNIEDVEGSLLTFLKKSELANGNAKREAENYLQLNNMQRTMEDCLPEARRLALEAPFPTLPESLMNLVRDKGFTLSQEQAVEFIKTAAERKPLTSQPYKPSSEPTAPENASFTPQAPRRTLNPDNPENLSHKNCRRPFRRNKYLKLAGAD